jgi:hypothetical protein
MMFDIVTNFFIWVTIGREMFEGFREVSWFGGDEGERGEDGRIGWEVGLWKVLGEVECLFNLSNEIQSFNQVIIHILNTVGKTSGYQHSKDKYSEI